jgi:dihydrolipoamide dehydrogenase
MEEIEFKAGESMDKDILIIGGGPGGYVAAIRASQLGARAAVIEKHKLGGTCLNRGCVPTKALYRNAEVLNTLKNAEELGINVESYHIDAAVMHRRKQSIIDQLVTGVEQLLKANKVEIILGEAVIKDKNTVTVNLKDGSVEEISAANIIIATGSKPAVPLIPGADLPGIMSSDDILNFSSIPESLAVIGGGVIGMECAGIFNALGTKVKVIEFMPSILPMVDSEITKRLTPSLKKKGIDINTSMKVMKIVREGEDYVITCEGKKGEVKITAKQVLMSVGRTPVVEGFGLENLSLGFDRKGIKVNENFETSVKGIYAIGDVNGKSMLAHAASHQGIRAVEHILRYKPKEGEDIIPSCIFIFPEIASVGITEEEAKNKGISYKTSKFMFGANCKALTVGEPEGMVKVISSKNEEGCGETLLGVHIMGPHASDLIHEASLAVANDLKLEDIINTVHAHPTLSEAFSEAVMGLKGEAIHMVNSKR